DAAAEHHDVGGVPLLEQLDHAAEERHVRAGENGQADRVHVLLDGGRDDLLRRLVQPGVDDFHASVAQRAGHDLRSAVVPVKTGLRDDHPDLAHDGKRNRNAAAIRPPARLFQLAQSTQGMPFLAMTEPPCAPVVGRAVAEFDADGVAPGTLAFAPRFTWTCPGATAALAVALTPNSDAILAPLAPAPVP